MHGLLNVHTSLLIIRTLGLAREVWEWRVRTQEAYLANTFLTQRPRPATLSQYRLYRAAGALFSYTLYMWF